ncbi:bifunctional [glutamate--ammonia ligase]-adenylyl-L-tyrosine phosphorylase/[glutamate--ammonia-ligase] adenylyltransferase [soil metagenome]
MIKALPELASYSELELEEARRWPAIDRYLGLLQRTASKDALSEWHRLKYERHEAWLKSAIALYHRKATDEEICFSWSRAADRHIEVARNMSGLDKTDVAVFALGKLGAEELNLSSDIDLMLIRSDSDIVPLKEAREFVRLLNESDEWGFCHRVDLALRPGGTAAALIPTVSQFENHYGYHGEAWERLAFVRFRHIAGGEKTEVDTQAKRFARGFSYRRHLDYSVFEELRLLIHRIRRENPADKKDEFHLKLHPGGIRDIELFVHALQTIHGGRRTELQTNRTEHAIQKLADCELVTRDEAQVLSETYWYYRNLENKIQAENDEQTYKIHDPKSLAEVRARAERIIAISSAGFPAVTVSEMPTVEDLVKRGFDEATARESLEEIRETHVLSKKSERDEREKDLFLSSFLNSLEASGGDLDLGLGLLVDFIKTTRAKATLFSLLNREPALVRQLAMLFGVSPWAGHILCSRPELLDSFILRQEAANLSSLDTAQVLDSLSERRLLGELIATLHFLESKDLEACVTNLTDLADSIATDLMLATANEIGCEPLGIVALGKWGGRELGLRSDLDFVFLTNSLATTDQQRLARRFLNRITEAHRGGSIYQVDLRLRPSGHAGPILVQLDRLTDHLKNGAEAWERQSWLRARSLEKLPNQIPTSVRDVILDRGLNAGEEAQLGDIANRLFKTIPTFGEPKKTIDLKLVNGGLAPIEFAAQICILRSGPSTSQPNRKLLETSTRGMLHFLEGIHAQRLLMPKLEQMHLWLRRIEQWIRVTGDVAGSNLNLSSKEFRRFAKTSGENETTFPRLLISKLEESSADLKTLLGR